VPDLRAEHVHGDNEHRFRETHRTDLPLSASSPTCVYPTPAEAWSTGWVVDAVTGPAAVRSFEFPATDPRPSVRARPT
jgi:hypothetical protein